MTELSSAAAARRLGEEEFRRLLEESRPALVALFRSYGIDRAEAEDILQDAAIVLVKRWDSLDDPKAFLLGIVRRGIFQLFRSRRIQSKVQFDEKLVEHLAGCPQLTVEAQCDAQKLLSSLPEKAGSIVEMRYGQGLRSHEIASMLGCSDTSVRMTATRGLRRLRQLAEAWGYRR
jgi:RNA polymerase sigma factor (sigma-70 family)